MCLNPKLSSYLFQTHTWRSSMFIPMPFSFLFLPSVAPFFHFTAECLLWGYKICSVTKTHSSRARHPGMQNDEGLGGIITNKASGGDGIPAELFQILKDDAVKVLHSICQQIWKTQQWSQDWKRSVFILIPKKGNAKECSNYQTIVIISHASKIMPQILQARLQQNMYQNFQNVKAGVSKGRGTRDQIANICCIIEKAREFQKNIFCFIDYTKAFECVDHNKLWKIL